jgi:hypothetical protein
MLQRRTLQMYYCSCSRHWDLVSSFQLQS